MEQTTPRTEFTAHENGDGSYKLPNGTRLTIQYVALVPSPWGDTKLKNDRWLVTIGAECFDYFTGLGHRMKPKHLRLWLHEEYNAERHGKLVAPQPNDILSCLISDASANDTSFNEWCDNSGFDSDSIKAFSTYSACCETAKKLRKAVGHDVYKVMMEDYNNGLYA